jgi:hypothetical protein
MDEEIDSLCQAGKAQREKEEEMGLQSMEAETNATNAKAAATGQPPVGEEEKAGKGGEGAGAA